MTYTIQASSAKGRHPTNWTYYGPEDPATGASRVVRESRGSGLRTRVPAPAVRRPGALEADQRSVRRGPQVATRRLLDGSGRSFLRGADPAEMAVEVGLAHLDQSIEDGLLRGEELDGQLVTPFLEQD